MKTYRENDVANGSRNFHRINDASKGCMTTVVCFLSIGVAKENYLKFVLNILFIS